MKREIKFRAWHPEHEEMVYFRPDVICIDAYQSLALVTLMEEKSEFLQQYTGLKDKNGKEIYEGDVLKGDDDGNDAVVYKGNKFILEPLGDDCIYWTRSEVIGNIYENPELLEASDE
ncbi:hypothetical protein KAR91_34345 [Candidatus Pacearchaeota archaeon]|nr:hypothetical protein [Candidatus Pacearchaeota archaeon]